MYNKYPIILVLFLWRNLIQLYTFVEEAQEVTIKTTRQSWKVR